MFLCMRKRKRPLATDISCLTLQLFTVKKLIHSVHNSSLPRVMARRLTASEALQSVFELGASSGHESEIEEDPQFPLPTIFSDDESLTPPDSPVRSSNPTHIHTSASPTITSLPVAGTLTTDVEMSSPARSPTLPALSPSQPLANGSAIACTGPRGKWAEVAIYFRVGGITRNFNYAC